MSRNLTFATGCSGIGAPEVAWGDRLGWKCLWNCEIEPFPAAVLKQRWPEVPNAGDFLTLAARIEAGELEAPDVFIAGTPCQAFSVAGLRNSLDDKRGGLTLEYCRIADAMDRVRAGRGLPATVFVWENVPGVFGTKDNAFGCFLAGLAGLDELPPPTAAAGRTRVVCLGKNESWPGGCSTLNTSEWPNAAAVCLLSAVLAPDSVRPTHYLSPAACLGILRRAEKRGRALPAALRQALEAQAARSSSIPLSETAESC